MECRRRVEWTKSIFAQIWARRAPASSVDARTQNLSRIRALRDESRGANKAQLAAAPLTGTRHAARRYQAPKSASLREEWRKAEVWRRTALRRTTPRPDLVKRRGWSLPRGKTTGPSMAFRQVKPKGGSGDADSYAAVGYSERGAEEKVHVAARWNEASNGRR